MVLAKCNVAIFMDFGVLFIAPGGAQQCVVSVTVECLSHDPDVQGSHPTGGLPHMCQYLVLSNRLSLLSVKNIVCNEQNTKIHEKTLVVCIK